MFWVIRGTDNRKGEDYAFVVETETEASAELWAMRRGVEAIIIAPADENDIEQARRANRLWRSTSSAPKYFCFGRPIGLRQLLCIMLAGVMTVGLVIVRTSRPAATAVTSKAKVATKTTRNSSSLTRFSRQNLA
jgi:hypothetical protein